MTLPHWVSPKGLFQHFLIGIGVAYIFALVGWPKGAAIFTAFYGGLLHEWADGDLPAPPWNGGYWNGLLDIAAFVVGAIL